MGVSSLGGLGYFFGSDAARGLAQAKLQLQESEDRAMKIDPKEGVDLQFHIEKEGQRTQIIIWRGRVIEQVMTQHYNRTLLYLTVGFAILFMKTGMTFSDLLGYISKIYHVFTG